LHEIENVVPAETFCTVVEPFAAPPVEKPLPVHDVTPEETQESVIFVPVASAQEGAVVKCTNDFVGGFVD